MLVYLKQAGAEPKLTKKKNPPGEAGSCPFADGQTPCLARQLDASVLAGQA
jgi:hypothetical protein